MDGRVPFTLTYVTYEDGDVVGLLMALLTLTPIFIVVSLTTLVVFGVMFERSTTGTSHSLVFLIGQLMNDGFSRMLKSAIDMSGSLVYASKRPGSSDRDECGMPSNHAQSVCFYATYASLILIFDCSFRARWTMPRNILVGLLILLSILVTSSRVYLGYHTSLQVFVGAVLGVAVACTFRNTCYPYLFRTIERMILSIHRVARCIIELHPPKER